ncbi:maleylpyruvate isomerase family mycothiol-dependent enzyme [Microbacterium sp. STN6]|uniref:maleylpyruvate isomerase family mycothiol-dependent enzyme n=1 Tax=Microbacterium sp. STN6 TaxID=2995588 RepID=UPI002260ADDA|nr:maleylpyruvate isomerase family mycothiol-dependent enzyme [Microbacterium sp. STN6]MCX7521226.1 maleylpyruvate isomerase family mycothiol-dependent enzyme [Microbacterium sp. STN6]
MSDYAKHLPLSLRPRVDETGVSAHWDTAMGDTLEAIATMLERLSPEQWESPSLCEGWRVRDVAGHIVWRVGASTGDMLRDGFSLWPRKHLNPMRAMDELSLKQAEADYASIVNRIRAIAVARRSGEGRRGITELTEVVVHGFDMASPLGIDLGVDGTVTGAVALRRSLLLPAGVRQVIRRRTLNATDAGWQLGRGPQIDGTAEAIVLFLFGRAALPKAVSGETQP